MLTLAACDSTGGAGLSFAPPLPGTDAARNTPPPADGRRRGEDALVVGHRLMAENEPELALKAYLRAASEQGINADVLSSLGSANLALGRLGQAEMLLRRALELDPEYVPALNNLGVVLMERDKVGEARVVFQQAYALDSGETDSIRENLRLAIARSEGRVYDDPETDPTTYSLVREAEGEAGFVTLSDL
jgi:Flp pilus assembly protein TadD